MATLTAVCILEKGGSKVEGTIAFEQKEGGPTRVTGKVCGLKPGLHGFHIHQFGDYSEGEKIFSYHFARWLCFSTECFVFLQAVSARGRISIPRGKSTGARRTKSGTRGTWETSPLAPMASRLWTSQTTKFHSADQTPSLAAASLLVFKNTKCGGGGRGVCDP